MKNSTKKTPAFFQVQANPTMQPPFPVLPMYMMHPGSFPKPPQKRRKLIGIGDKNGGEKLRVFTRLKGFKAKESLVWKEITTRFGSEIKHGELLSVAEVVAANAGIQLDRDAKRRKSVLIKWFDEHWMQISPYLKYVILEDRKNLNGAIPNFESNMNPTSTFNNQNNFNNMQPGITSCNPIPANTASSIPNITNNTMSIAQQNNMMWPNNNSMNFLNQIQNENMASNTMNTNSSLMGNANTNGGNNNNNIKNPSNNTRINQNAVNSAQMQYWMQIQARSLNQNPSVFPAHMQNNMPMFIPPNQYQNNQTTINPQRKSDKNRKQKK